MQFPLIALIEDEEHLAQGLLFNLEAEGYTTHHEADGEAALAWLLSAKPQPVAVLLDVMLPSRDGFSIVKALRSAGNYVPWRSAVANSPSTSPSWKPTCSAT